MTITVGINGFGRIGRCTLAHIASSGRDDIRVVKANATGPLETAAHLLRYDSVHGRFPGEITVGVSPSAVVVADRNRWANFGGTLSVMPSPRHSVQSIRRTLSWVSREVIAWARQSIACRTVKESTPCRSSRAASSFRWER